ncbi:MAG: Uma2 family endonuclease [Planctomycetota bacterium]|nr:Uma2 family endonuclease [Planctomycetota bacterium]
MSTHLHLTTSDYNRMVELGAFDHLNRKIELIRGEICEMNPAGPIHDDLIAFLLNWSVRSTDPSIIRVTVQTGLELIELDSRPEPDLLWVRAGRYLDRHPNAADVKLAIEVSDSSLQNDLVRKSALYAEAGIVEYWIVDVPSKCIHVFRLPDDGCYSDRSLFKLEQTVSPLAHCSSPLDLRDLFGE